MTTYVFDTSVLLASPKALYNYPNDKIVIPLVVLKELESKRHDVELGWTARETLRNIEEIRVSGGDLQQGVVIHPSGGVIQIETNHADNRYLPEVMRTDRSHDTRVLSVAAALHAEGENVVLLSKDLPMRIIASAILGLQAQDFTSYMVKDSGWTGIEHHSVNSSLIGELYASRSVNLRKLDPEVQKTFSESPVNTAFILTGVGAEKSSALARKTSESEIQVINGDTSAFGVRGRSAEQRVALAQLLNDDLGIVSLGGPGGTGKSLLALAAGLEAVIEKRTHKKIMVFRPMYAVGGQDLGYLPGTAEEKLDPWTAATYDALSTFCGKNVIEEIQARDLLEVLPLTHIRGRTFTDAIVIIDEAQNLEWNVILTALSRIGENSRVFLTHDVAQRDNLHVGRYDGIAAVIERLKGQQLFSHTALTRSERSAVAALVTEILDQ